MAAKLGATVSFPHNLRSHLPFCPFCALDHPRVGEKCTNMEMWTWAQEPPWVLAAVSSFAGSFCCCSPGAHPHTLSLPILTGDQVHGTTVSISTPETLTTVSLAHVPLRNRRHLLCLNAFSIASIISRPVSGLPSWG